jgi:hypothetical protein
MDERARMMGELKAVLDEVGSEHVLVGGLAAGYHGRVRATVDVDLLVPGRKLKQLSQALAARGFELRNFPDMIRVYPPGSNPNEAESIANLVSRDANPVPQAAFSATEPAQILGHQVNLIRRGALVALKFHAAVSRERRLGDRYQDLADIERIVVKRFDAEDRALARSIADKMYPGAADELEKLVEDLKNGRPVSF